MGQGVARRGRHPAHAAADAGTEKSFLVRAANSRIMNQIIDRTIESLLKHYINYNVRIIKRVI